MNTKKLVNYLLIFIITFSLSIIKTKAYTYDLYTAKYKCPVREKPSEYSNAIKNGNDDVRVFKYDTVDYLGTSKGPNNGKPNQDWYKVRIDYAAREYTGYVAKACMYEKESYTYKDEKEFEEEIKVFPEHYKKYLRNIHAIYPKWKFVPDNTKLDFKASVSAESEKYQSAIHISYPSLIYKDKENPDGIIVDGTSWYAPCYDAVGYYLDPRNFLNPKRIFMFESLIYNKDQDQSVKDILKGSFMDSEFTEDGYTKTYTNAFIDAAIKSGVSSTHLASRSLQEMGYKMSSAASGTVPGYEGYYNFYNIGAYSGVDNYIKGLEYAKEKGWNSRQKAITGGAMFLKEKYIDQGKDTIYFQKWNVSSNRKSAPYTYQYMTNIMAPFSESSKIYESYKTNNKLNNAYTFKIPVYDDMPNDAFKVSRTDTIGGNEVEKPKPEPEEKPEPIKPVVLPETKVKNAGYNISGEFISKIDSNSDISSIRNNLIKQDAVVGSLNSSWTSKTSGKIATGDIIEVDKKKKYTVVIYGDIAGDSEISVVDLLYLKKYILGDIKLSPAYKEAADVNKDKKVDVVDLLLLKKHLLGEYKINQ